MPLAIPRYIIDARIQDTTLRYEWDDWNVQDIFQSDDRDFEARMSDVSFRGNLAFTNACGEWITHRFNLLSNDPVPLQNIEAGWAAVIDPSYAVYWEPPDEDWLGHIRGPLSLAIMFILEATGNTYDYANPAQDSDHASNLAEHIMTDSKPFQIWRERVVERLLCLYPLDDDDPLGDVVPRQALDPDFDFRPEMTPNLIETYLRSLSTVSNPFLRDPGKMIEAGFVGTPYEFDLEMDRTVRMDY